MNELSLFLNKYFNEVNINDLTNILLNKGRFTLCNDRYFVKVAINNDKFSYTNYVNELKFYQSNGNVSFIPKLIDFYLDETYCVIILNRINGIALSKTRNDFEVSLDDDLRLKIVESIRQIQCDKVNCIFEEDRILKLKKYYESSIKHLPITILNILEKKIDEVDNIQSKLVLSHGDLILSNIMINDSEFNFVDWEYASYRSKYYDIVYFLLFSKSFNSLNILEKLDDIDFSECYKEGIYICLKEIYNWSKLDGSVSTKIVLNNINRWLNELSIILDLL